jgi:hypothetical protein
MDPATQERYKERTSVERVFGRLKRRIWSRSCESERACKSDHSPHVWGFGLDGRSTFTIGHVKFQRKGSPFKREGEGCAYQLKKNSFREKFKRKVCSICQKNYIYIFPLPFLGILQEAQ